MSEKQSSTRSWTPPEGFQKVKSHFEGVVVYAPQQVRAIEDKVKSYACPNCGANVSYDVSAGGIACEYCGYVAPVKAVKLGRSADEFEFTLETISQSSHGWGTKRQILQCDSCGGKLSIPEGTISTTCPFCSSNKVNLTISPEESLRPRFLIPFKITLEQIQPLATSWLGKGWFHPDELAAKTIIRRFKGVYLPFWTFDALVYARWRAQVGYEKTERHYNAREKRWETRTRIVWRWQNGDVRLSIDDFLVTGSNRNHINHQILKKLYPFNMQSLVAYEPDYLAGWQAQAYETTLTEAWEIGKSAIREKAKKACYHNIPSNHVRNFSMSADFSEESWRYILLPVYLSSYRYEEKIFQVMVNGLTGAIAGQKPVAWWKIWLAIAALLAPGVILGLIGLPLLLLGGAGIIPISLGIVLYIIGIVISVILYNKARQSEA
ncbi:MAG: TFIIB-type zinc ribbon-containing protein [Chloroflexota bacterium]|nr:TFIIB-type zinc ribbon-containing protein [Chloroflexota bacterium]